jgi:hypothetical protein
MNIRVEEVKIGSFESPSPDVSEAVLMYPYYL